MSRNEKNNIINNVKKAKTTSQKVTKEDKVIKTPLYKIFMDENSTRNKKKLHLKKNQTLYSDKDTQVQMNMKQSNKFRFVFDLNLELFSYKILEAKYNSNPDLYEKINLDNLIAKKKCHYLAQLNEMGYCTSILREYLKREYTLKEVTTRIPQYASYYKNYLIFFCKPCFNQYTINKKMVRHMEKVAQVFYNENYAEEEKEENKEQSQEKKKLPKIFSKEIMKDIENCDNFTYVNSEDAMVQIQLINKKLKRTEKDSTENKNKNKNEINNAYPIEIEQSSIFEENRKITPIYEKKEFNQKIKNKKKIVFDMDKSNELSDNIIKESQSTTSINLLIKEMDKENKGNLLLNNIKDLNENPYTFRKINGIISPSNKLNMNVIKPKSIKNVNNNCILIQNGKTTNNINININNLTIGQKIISQNGSFNRIIKNLRELNNINNMNNDKILKKTITKFKYKDSNNNSILNTKDKNNKKNIKNIKNNTESAPHGNKIQNIQIKSKIKKNGLLTLPPQAMNLLPNFQTNFTNKNYNKIIPGTLTNQVKKTRNQSIFRLGHNSGSTTSLYKNKKLNYYNLSKDPSKLGRFTIHASDQINFRNIINSNNGKNHELLSEERTSSNTIKRPKKIFTSIMNVNKGSQFFNLKNKLDSFKNNNNGNLISPMNANKKELVLNRMKIKELKLKENQFNLHKLLNFAPNNKRSKSTSK